MSVGKTSDGVIYFSVRYKDLSGKVIQKKVQNKAWRTLREAKEEERKFLDSVKPSGGMLFSSLYSMWLTEQKTKNRPATIHNHEWVYNYYLKQYFADKPINMIDKALLRSWQLAITNAGIRQSTAKLIQATMSNILSYAVRYDILPKSPMVSIMKKEEPKQAYEYWTLEEFTKFISVVDNIAYKTFFCILFFGGLRFGEILGLQVKDYVDGKLIINKQLNKNGLLAPVKNKNGERVIGLDDFTRSCLDELLQSYDCPDTAFLFESVPNSRRAFSEKKDKYCRLAGVKRIRIHDFRHSHATFLLRMGYSYPDVAKRLGDSVSTVISTYGHAYEDSDERIVSSLNSDFVRNLLHLPTSKM